MTANERLIWASVFAGSLQHFPISSYSELEQAAGAARDAGKAIENLRKLKRKKDTYINDEGESYREYIVTGTERDMLLEMLK